jgi:hypothetical protein
VREQWSLAGAVAGQLHLSGASPVHSFLSSSIAFFSRYIVTLGGNAGRKYGSDQRDKD